MTPLAVIREAECIGCTKCIQACPFDAIIGSAQQMHTVIANECVGCELCIAPCPVDCIDMIPITKPHFQINKTKTKQRVIARKQRQTIEKNPEEISNNEVITQKEYIQAALARVKAKKTL